MIPIKVWLNQLSGKGIAKSIVGSEPNSQVASGLHGNAHSHRHDATGFRVPGFRAGSPRSIAPPVAPTDPYMPSRAYGPSRHELASAIRWCYVNTATGSDAPAVYPSNGAMTWRPLLSTGSLRTMVPPLRRYYGMLRLPAVRLDSLRILHEPIPPSRPWFAPLGRGRPTGGQGVVGTGLPIRYCDGNVGGSQVPGEP
jgi:hypothetical protein